MSIPTTRIATAAGYMTSDCLSEEFSCRRIYITEEITNSMAAEICCQINHLAALSNEDITLWIMSPGGSVSAGSAILDTMNTCGCDFKTIVMGTAASMAAVIASSGTKGKRYIGANSGMMIHQALGGFSGQTADILRTAQHIEKTNKRLYEILARNCGVSVQQIAVDCDRDYHLNAEEAIAYGLADHIFSGFED
ncbi:ATP-dependent Clp protease proteolytic subunit [Blautia glucerasea]|jgi:ATP-dependent Clp protease protease subunit|uniref:ClpP family protease n=1 Tax=Blautia glucerasea TaxID=536633 RepID=UPI001D015CDC|nr:ATP-dependent Clp protease proteolytic subunit [Blautia glucerasea]MCB5386953.1 ATP-dependent Clp protease proteolytic subunit [Blautia glucerasea]MCB5421581.1 ATP-dependent Clp protease proteolytic subunit [Blautia luti]